MNPVSMSAVAPAAVTPPKPGAARGTPHGDATDTFSPALLMLLAPAVAATVVQATPVPVGDAAVPGDRVPTLAGDALAGAGTDVLPDAGGQASGRGVLAQGPVNAAPRATGAVPPGLARAAAITHAKAPVTFAAPVRAALAEAAPVATPQPDTTPATTAAPAGIVASDVPATAAPVVSVETAAAANVPQAAMPKPSAPPAAAEAPAPTGDAVVESVRRAAGASAAANARQRGANGDAQQDPGRNAPDTAPARPTRADASRPRGLAPAAAADATGPAPHAAVADVAPRTTPVHDASDGASAVTTTGAPHDPRLAWVDATAARAVRSDQVTLRIDGDAGGEARVRLAVRGQDVRATIVADDPALARRLEDGIGTLKQALGDRGFERAQVVVQSTTGSRHDAANDGARDPRNPQRDAQRDAETAERKDGRPGGDAQSRRRPGQDRGRSGR